MEKHIQADTGSRILPRSLACSRTCMVRVMESDTDNPMEGKFRCMQGFSLLQINILGILKSHKEVLAYWQIAQLLEQYYGGIVTEGAVRGALERLFPREFLLRRRSARGRLKGNRYALATDPCSYIQPCSSMGVVTESSTQSAGTTAPSILEEIDSKILSVSSKELSANQLLEALTESDIVFHWPNLAKFGFGTDQIRQIIKRLSQIPLPLTNLMQGLIYAEWELENEQMRDKTVTPITSPNQWVFYILARQGYYPRPSGYISPQEQAERDAEAEANALKQAQEKRLMAECALWIASLTTQERKAILPAQNGCALPMPEEVALRNYFRTNIWAKRQNEGVV